MPGTDLPKVQITNIDLAVHFFFYCVFTFLLIIGNLSQSQFIFLRKNPIVSALLVSIPFGGIVELIQGTKFVSRSTELADFIANSVGGLIGVVLFIFIYGSPKNFTTWNKRKAPKKTTGNNPHNTSL